MTKEERTPDGDAARERILEAAAQIIRSQGAEAATTRAVATAASMQPPTIYRLIGDKDALLDAVAEYELARYVVAKSKEKTQADPVEALRHGWDRHVEFGLANPAIFRIMSSKLQSPAAAAGLNALRQRIHAIALAGRLRGSEERATAMLHAACTGTVMSLLAAGEGSYPCLSQETRDVMLAAITTSSVQVTDDSPGSAASALRARLKDIAVLSAGERGLMDELLLRVSEGRTAKAE
ncbi:TetR/AcrR family transcriptional regulator [Undibacterium sp. Tian12W]|uniref:TetR/AcrR family transcriptional regulator n=1 Tax=Undibacterium sp. Tian12W TaxID=3413054 RepID=UPI003BF0CF13